MSEKTLAYPYSKAFFDLSLQENGLERANLDMQSILKIGSENPQLKLVLQNPLFPLEKKKAILTEVLSFVKPETKKLLDLLVENDRSALIFSVAEEFSRQYREYNQILSVEVTTAQSLKPDLENQIKTHIEKALSGKIELRINIDPEVIGGLMIQIGDKRYDGTIRKSLLDLKKSLLEKAYS